MLVGTRVYGLRSSSSSRGSEGHADIKKTPMRFHLAFQLNELPVDIPVAYLVLNAAMRVLFMATASIHAAKYAPWGIMISPVPAFPTLCVCARETR
jgi:hypothetical protein